MMPTNLNPPTQEEIDRLISQQNGDTGFYLLAIFSFIEAYIRHNFDELKYSNSKEQEHVYFPTIIRTLENFDSPFDSYSKYHSLNNKLIDLHTKYANKVRHDFAQIDNVVLASAVKNFLKFAKYHNFLTPELANLSDGSEFNEIKNRLPPKGSDITEMQAENERILSLYKEKK